MTLLVTYVLIALGVSFLCSLLEATLLTVTPATIATAREKGASWAGTLQELKNDVEKPLSAILTLNTIAHTMGAAGAGAEYVRQFGNASEAVFAAGLTLAILVVTEIIPKTWGAHYASTLAGPVTRILVVLVRVMTPFVWVAKQITRLIKPPGSGAQPVSREEILAMARLGAKIGVLKQGESATVENIIQLNEVSARDIMTPRTVVFSLAAALPVTDAVNAVEKRPFSRIPVHGDKPDDFTGFVLRSDILLAELKSPGGGLTLKDLARPLAVASRDMRGDRLFHRFIDEREQIMLVTDEFGTAVGLVTLEDVVETIFGLEIMDEQDRVADMQILARKLWKLRARKMGIDPVDEGERGTAS